MQIIRDFLEELFINLNVSEIVVSILTDVSFLLFSILLSIIAYLFVKLIFVKAIKNPGGKKRQCLYSCCFRKPTTIKYFKINTDYIYISND